MKVTDVSHDTADQLVQHLKMLRSFTGHSARFWPAFLELTTRLCGAGTGTLLVRSIDGKSWTGLHTWPAQDRRRVQSPELRPSLEHVAETAVTASRGWAIRKVPMQGSSDRLLLGLRLDLDRSDQAHAAIFLLDDMPEDDIEHRALQLKLVADTPALYLQSQASRQAVNEMVVCSDAMDLMVLLNEETRYMAAAMTFVNEIASRFRCQRVSLGWIENSYVRLQTISHMERFEKKMDIVQALESAMEEAFDQNEEIVLPLPRGSTAIARDHQSFARAQNVQYMLSVPIRIENEAVGVLTCERTETPFTPSDIRGLRMFCDQAARRLGDLKEHDRWFGFRIAATVRRKAAVVLGVEHTLAKCLALIICAAFMFLIFGELTYRIESPFILRSTDVRYIPAPFEGYIDDVHVEVGDQVQAGTLLLTLDTGDLLLEESEALANKIRYAREAEKARAENELADMKIALALADQASARLDLVRYNLNRAEVRAPFSGIVVEGDLDNLLGAPVSKGDILFKVARVETLYVELEVSEQNIHELREGAVGELAFVSQPDLTFPLEVVRIDPVAIAKKAEGNVFRVRCRTSGAVADWWRPGMSGIAKIHAGTRDVLWILSHRTVDFLRMKLWW